MTRLISIITFIFLFSLSAVADEISYEQAETCAKAFFAGQNRKAATSIAVKRINCKTGTKNTNTSLSEDFYVFNNLSGKGFVIISADSRFIPVLAYSFDNEFKTENVPENIKGWLTGIEDQMKFLKNRKVAVSSEVSKQWKELNQASYIPRPIVHYQTAEWNQSDPFNGKTPVYSNYRTLTGCTQTALAIYMRFFSYPKEPLKPIERGYYLMGTYYAATVPATPNRYKWDDMPLEYNSACTQSQKDAVATVMADLGIMNEALYETGSTGTTTPNIAKNMATYMGYSKNSHERNRSAYTSAEWGDMLRNELDSGHPIPYSGRVSGGGHAYIIDGYASDNYFSINWGWGGVNNGYFHLDIFEPSHILLEDKYRFDQAATFGMVPDPEGRTVEEKDYKMRLDALGLSSGSPGILTEDMEVNTVFTNIFSDCAYDISPVTMAFNLMSGQHRKVCNLTTWTMYNLLPAWYGWTSITGKPFYLPRIRLGDYVKTYFINPQNNAEEIPVRITSPYETRGIIPVIDAAYIEAEDTYKAGDQLIKNIFYGRNLPSSVTWFFDGRTDTSAAISLTSGKHTLKAVLRYKDGSIETIVREINVE